MEPKIRQDLSLHELKRLQHALTQKQLQIIDEMAKKDLQRLAAQQKAAPLKGAGDKQPQISQAQAHALSQMLMADLEDEEEG